MASLIVRNLPEATHRALKARAKRAGRSTEAEVRLILEAAIRPDTLQPLGSLLAAIGQDIGGVELDIPREVDSDEPVSFT
jgi:plasmid stability protein-like protein